MYRLPFELTDSAKVLHFTILGGPQTPQPPPLNDATDSHDTLWSTGQAQFVDISLSYDPKRKRKLWASSIQAFNIVVGFYPRDAKLAQVLGVLCRVYVCLSVGVCHKSAFYREGWTHWTN